MADPPPSDPPAPSGGAPPPPAWPERVAQWRDALPEITGLRLVAAAAVAAVVVGVAYFVLREPAPPPLVLPRAAPETQAPSGAGPTTTAAPSTITVHAAGAVARPGIYSVAGGARVADVVTAAGGSLPDADLDQVNLAAKVADAERVHIPRKGEVVPPAPTAAAGAAGAAAGPGGRTGPVDLNTATAEQLDALPGVGPATSQAILDFRTSNGRFRSVDDLLEVRGIGPAKLEDLRPLVRV